MAKGATAAVATKVVTTSPTMNILMRRSRRQNALTSSAFSLSCRPCASTSAISPMTAAKDIWKLASNRLSGDRMRMTSAASATLRIVSAGRSSNTAMSTTLIMIQARTVGTAAPERRR
jgi:hypothetical protein